MGSGHGRWYEHRYKCGVGVCVGWVWAWVWAWSGCGVGVCVGVVGNNRVGVLRQLSHGQLSCFCLRAKNVCGVYGRAPLFDQRMEGRPC